MYRVLNPYWNENPRYVNIADKDTVRRLHIMNMFNRTIQMFEYEGLPETISKRNLELIIQSAGYAGIIQFKGNDRFKAGLYAVWGSLGGEPDPYYMPTKFVFANPAMGVGKITKISDTYVEDVKRGGKAIDIGKDVAIIPNDSLYMGLMPIAQCNGQFLSEAWTTLRVSLINYRAAFVGTAADDNVKKAMDLFIKKLEKGDLSAIKDATFNEFGGLNIIDTGGSIRGRLTEVIETIQYIKANWFNDLGVQANYNMKRESLNDSEISANDLSLLPLVDDMLQTRKDGVERVNNLFGTNISVDLCSAWKIARDDIKLEQQAVSQLTEEPKNNKDGEDNEDVPTDNKD